MEELKNKDCILKVGRASPYCESCGGHHEPDPPASWVDFEGYRFKPPFLCMCCGKIICARQFAYGRCCAPCDMGACQYGNIAFRRSAGHLPPSWGRHNEKAGFLAFVKHTGATPSPEVAKLK